MSAIVTIPHKSGIPDKVEVPSANNYDIDSDTGFLHLKMGSWSDKVAVFKEWLYVVIEPNRGPNGRFIKKG